MADFMEYIRKDLTPAVKIRQDLERRITDEIVKALFQHGYVVRIHDGEEFCTKRISDPVAVQRAVQSTDEDTIFVYHAGEDGPHIGTISLVYGNEGHDVVSDYTYVPELHDLIEPIVEKYNG